MAQQKGHPSKHDNVPKLVKDHIAAGTYLDTTHAFLRMAQRQVTLPEMLHVLRNGYHEKSKDEFKEQYNAWNYAIRGKTVDKRELRVCVSFDESDLLIITAIDLDAKD